MKFKKKRSILYLLVLIAIVGSVEAAQPDAKCAKWRDDYQQECLYYRLKNSGGSLTDSHGIYSPEAMKLYLVGKTPDQVKQLMGLPAQVTGTDLWKYQMFLARRDPIRAEDLTGRGVEVVYDEASEVYFEWLYVYFYQGKVNRASAVNGFRCVSSGGQNCRGQ